MKNQNSYIRFILNSMDDNVGKNTSSYFVYSIAIIIIWIFLSSTGLQEAFKSIANLQQMMDVWQGGSVAIDYFENEDTKSWWESISGVFSSEEDTQNKMSPFMRSFIANSSAILACILFLAIVYQYIHKKKTDWKNSVVVIGSSCVPLTVGMFIAYVLFKMASKSESENIPSILYLLGCCSILTALMTSLIMLYVNISSVLLIKARARYYTTILTVFIFAGVLGAVTNYLS